MISDVGLPIISMPFGLSNVMELESIQTISTSSFARRVATKSCAFNGMKSTVCVPPGARSKSVCDSIAKQALYTSVTRVIGGSQSVGAIVGEVVGPEVGEVVGLFVG